MLVDQVIALYSSGYFCLLLFLLGFVKLICIYLPSVSALLQHGRRRPTKPLPGQAVAQLQVPKSLFQWFYFVGALLLSALISYKIYLFYHIYSQHRNRFFGLFSRPQNTFFSLFLQISVCLHLTRRWLETAFLFPYSPTSTMHLGHFLLGLSYYPVLTLNMLFLGADPCPPPIQEPSPSTELFYLALSCFHVACYFQYLSHKSLFLKKESLVPPHRCPPLYLETILDCPHYFMEVCIFTSTFFMIFLTSSSRPWLQTPFLLNVLWVLANLAVSASANSSPSSDTNKKYKIIPFLY